MDKHTKHMDTERVSILETDLELNSKFFDAKSDFPSSFIMAASIYMIVLLCPVQFSSVTQSCLTLCNPMNCSTPGLPVYPGSLPWIESIQLPEST